MSNSRDIEVGTMLTVAMLSPVVGLVVRTWTDDGTALWQVDDPDGLRACLGAGVMARTRVPADRFREVAMLGANTGTLLLPYQNRLGNSFAPRCWPSGRQGGVPAQFEQRAEPP